MKLSHILVGLVCAPLVVLAAEMDSYITTHESISQKLTPNILEGSFSFSDESKDASVIKEHLNALISQAKKLDNTNEMCSGGGYQILPKYEYKDSKQTFLGYRGMLSLRCNFKSIEDYNTLVAQVEKAKASSVIMAQNMPRWIVSQNSYKEALVALRTTLLKTVQQQAEVFSKELDMKCSFNSVVENQNGAIPFAQEAAMPAMQPKMMALKSAPMEAPIQSDSEVSLEADVTYVCISGTK